MQIQFTKMHGLGNDFMMLDLTMQSIALDSDSIQRWGNRHTGVGFDQLLLIEKTGHKDADFHYRIFNCDGQEVEQCGNGARCAARFVKAQGLTKKNKIVFSTANDLLHTEILENNQVRASLGLPIIDKKFVLTLSNQPTFQATTVSIGNPHIVLFVESCDLIDIDAIGYELNHHECFPQGVNVGFLQKINDNHAKLRVYERGVGETQACGSGAIAAMAAAVNANLLATEASFELLGGELILSWVDEKTPIEMQGPAEFVFTGTLHI